jgi:hypothetical protein
MKSSVLVIILFVFLLAVPCWAGPQVTKSNSGVGTRSGTDADLISGTAGTDTYAAVWNADGDLVDGAGVPYVVGGTDVSDADLVNVITLDELKMSALTAAPGTPVAGQSFFQLYNFLILLIQI